MSLLDTASLIVTPNAYKEGKLYSVIPSNGNGDFSVTRATTATRVNAAGLVELVPYNLLTYSQDFANVTWTKLNSTILSSNNLAPDGTLTAARLNMPSASSSQLFNSFPSVAGSYTTSIWVRLVSGTGNFKLGFFDNVSILTDSITVTSTWQRFSVTKNVGVAVGTRGCWLYSNDLNQVIEVWGGQVVEGSQAKDYFATTTRLNIPRLDYSLGSCPNILLEPQRTNLALRSNTFQNAAWTTSGLSVADNTQLGIDGLTSACLVTTSSTGNFLFQNVSVIPLTSYTFTFYAKRGTMTDMKYRVRDITTGADVITTTSYYSQTNASTFTRISVTVTAPLACLSLRFYIMSDTNSIGTAIITSCQVEAGAYATSYIPTTSASVTRNTDQISRGNIFTNGLITASGGTWFVDLRNNIPYIRDASSGGAIYISDNTTPTSGNVLRIWTASGLGRLFIQKVVSNAGSNLFTTTTDNVKIAIKWNGATADVFVNGVKVVTATAFPATALQDLISFAGIPTYLNSMALFPTPLTDTQCIALTT
jgi:hypothetical protein